jgi:hypothetical protein
MGKGYDLTTKYRNKEKIVYRLYSYILPPIQPMYH